MTEQPKALRLADALDYDPMPMSWYLEAAAELRRLHAENEALRADAERLSYLEGDAMTHVFKIGRTWYWKPEYGQPHRKAKTLRAAIDAEIQRSKA